MSLVVPVAHDFTCPWCWIGQQQARRLVCDFGVAIEWRAYDLWPPSLTPPPMRHIERDPRRPSIPTRLELAYTVDGLPPPSIERPKPTSTHNAHEAVEFAKLHGVQDDLVERIYEAHWELGLSIESPDVLAKLAADLVPDVQAMKRSIERREFAERIIEFDQPAYESGVYYVPTFFVGDERLAEQPYACIEQAIRRELSLDSQVGVYACLQWGAPPEGRPYVVMNMVSTLDGKSVTGERDEPVADLGSETDHATMRQIEGAVDAVLIGAGSLRATPGLWYAEHLWRIVVTGSGQIPVDGRFFTDAPDRAIVATTASGAARLGQSARTEQFPGDQVDIADLLKFLRVELGIVTLLVEGGSELNAQLFSCDCVDELFLTVAPKVKLGRRVPTIADGTPLSAGDMLRFRLVTSKTVGDETFLRYRRN
ncbi:MAG: dihydrofolate reductase family protein [Armatimonadetes bacterium]|nr:dihydrofolate reductase family protein [Armatimonadota bacterium]